MALDNFIKRPSSLIRATLSDTQKLCIIKEDLEDTEINQLSILSSIIDVQDSQNQGDAISQIINDTGNLNFEYNGRQYVIHKDGNNVRLDVVANADLIPGKVLGTTTSKTLDFNYAIDGVQIFSDISDVSQYTAEAIANTRVLKKLADAGIYANSDDSYISRFADASSDLVGTNSSALDLRNDILEDMNSLDDSQKSILSVFENIYTSLASISIGSDGEIHFNEARFYVAGFVGAYFLNAAIQVGSYITTAVLTVIQPVLGIIGYALTAAFSLISNLWSAANDDGPSINLSSSDNFFAMPVIQNSISRSTWVSGGSTFRESLLEYMKDHGNVCNLTLPTGSFLVWYSPSTDTINTEFYLSYLGPENNVQSDVWRLPNYYWDSQSQRSFTTPYISGSRLDSNNVVRISSWYINAESYPVIENEIDTHVGNWTSTSWYIQLVNNLYLTTLWLYQPTFTYVNTANSYPGGKEGLMGFCRDYMDGSVSSYFWTNLTNTMIPDIVEHNWYLTSEQLWDGIENIFTTDNDPVDNWPADLSDIYSGISASYSDSLSASSALVSGYYFDRGKMSLYPPKYAPGAFAKTLAAILGIAVLVTAAVVATKLIKVKLRNKMAKKYINVSKLQDTYKADPTDTNYNLYYKELKSYNRLASLTGYSKLSYISGWELGDESTAAVGGTTQTIKDKLGVVQGSNPEVSLTSNDALLNQIREHLYPTE